MHPGLDVIPQMPQDGAFWAVRWFKEVVREKGYEDAPMIRAFMSKLRESDLKDPRDLQLGVNSSFDYTSRWSPQEVLLQIGLFPFIPIGTVWRNGKYVFSLRADSERLSLTIPPGDPEFRRASSKEATGKTDEKGNPEYRFLIPGRGNGYQVPPEGLDAQCFVLRPPTNPAAPDPTTVVIPCTELIRFYYCNSSPLAYALFNGELEHYQGPFGDNGIFNRSASVLGGPAPYIQLRSNMWDSDAEVIARMACDPVAYKGAAMIFSGLAKGNLDRRAPGATFPVSHPPFIGNTELAFRGRTIVQNGMKTILVLQIESCTGEVPWIESPTFRRDNDGRSDGTYDPTRPVYNEGGKQVIPVESDHPETRTPEPKESKAFHTQGAEPGVLITAFTLEENRFPATTTKKPRKAPPKPPTYREDPNRPTELLVDSPGHSVNPSPEAGSRLAKASLNFKEPSPDADTSRAPREFRTPPTAKAFQSLMGALGGRAEVRSCESLVIADHDGFVPGDNLSSFCPLKAAEDLRGTVKPSTVRKRAYLMPPGLNEPGQRRVAWIAEVNLADGGWFYLFDAEQREAGEGETGDSFSLTCIFKEGMPKMDKAELFLVLQRWVAHQFVFPYEGGKPWRRVRIPHHFGDEQVRVAKVLDGIRTEGTTKRERRKSAS